MIFMILYKKRTVLPEEKDSIQPTNTSCVRHLVYNGKLDNFLVGICEDA